MAQTARTTSTRAKARPVREPEPEEDDILQDEPEDSTDDIGDEDDDLFDEDEDDDFDDARSGFVKLDDLIDRLVLVKALEVGQRESTLPGQSGKLYDFVVTTTHVLSGEVTDLIDEVPMVLEEFQFTGVNVVGQLKPKLRTGKMLLGVVTKRPAQKRGMQDAWVINEPSERDRQVARKYLAALRRKRPDDF
jgi:hypothetical protein